MIAVTNFIDVPWPRSMVAAGSNQELCRFASALQPAVFLGKTASHRRKPILTCTRFVQIDSFAYFFGGVGAREAISFPIACRRKEASLPRRRVDAASPRVWRIQPTQCNRACTRP